jgi:hypothetical protein
MKTLTLIYWSRAGFGVLAALVCAALGLDNLFNGLSIGLIFYLISYYLLKWRFLTKVEKASKLFTTGIGAYFLTWIVAWVLLFTLTWQGSS